ncbi:MAG: major capsid protein [Sedimenticola sp.]
MFSNLWKKAKGLFAGAAAMLGFGSANAAVDPAITTAITEGQADLLTVVGALTVMAAVVYVARWIYARFV